MIFFLCLQLPWGGEEWSYWWNTVGFFPSLSTQYKLWQFPCNLCNSLNSQILKLWRWTNLVGLQTKPFQSNAIQCYIIYILGGLLDKRPSIFQTNLSWLYMTQYGMQCDYLVFWNDIYSILQAFHINNLIFYNRCKTLKARFIHLKIVISKVNTAYKNRSTRLILLSQLHY